MIFVLLAALLWSLGGVGIKLVQCDPMAISGFRSLFALPVLGLAAGLAARGGGAQIQPGLLLRGLSQPAVWAGAASYAVTVICFVIANKLTTAANAILLQYTAPIYVALLSWPLLREPVRRADWLATCGCLLGMAWFFTDRLSATGWLGNLVAIVSGIGFGLLPVMLRLSQRRSATGDDGAAVARLAPLLTVVLGNLLATVVGLPWMLTAQVAGTAQWLVLLMLGVFQIGLAYFFFTVGVRRVKAVEAMLVSTIEPILNPVWVALWTGERPSRSALIGGALIVLSVTAHGVASGLRTVRRGAP